jgi:hypothetical protein
MDNGLNLTAAISAAMALGLFVTIRRDWIPRGMFRALADIAILIAILIVMGVFINSFRG